MFGSRASVAETDIFSISVPDTVIHVNVVNTLKGHKKSVISLVYLEKRKTIVTCGYADKTIRVWRVFSGRNDALTGKNLNSVKVLKGHTDAISSVIRFSDDIVLSSSFDGTIRSWNIQSLLPDKIFGVHPTGVAVLGILKLPQNPDLFVSCDFKSNILVVSYSQNVVLQKFVVQDGRYVSHLALSISLPHTLFTVCSDNKLLTFDYLDAKFTGEFRGGHNKAVKSITSFLNHQNEEILVSGGREKEIFFWKVKDSKIIRKVRVKREIRSFLCYGRSILVVGCQGGYMEFFNLQTGKVVQDFKPHKKGISSMAWLSSFSHPGNDVYTSGQPKLITGSWDCTAKLICLESILQTNYLEPAGMTFDADIAPNFRKHLHKGMRDKNTSSWFDLAGGFTEKQLRGLRNKLIIDALVDTIQQSSEIRYSEFLVQGLKRSYAQFIDADFMAFCPFFTFHKLKDYPYDSPTTREEDEKKSKSSRASLRRLRGESSTLFDIQGPQEPTFYYFGETSMNEVDLCFGYVLHESPHLFKSNRFQRVFCGEFKNQKKFYPGIEINGDEEEDNASSALLFELQEMNHSNLCLKRNGEGQEFDPKNRRLFKGNYASGNKEGKGMEYLNFHIPSASSDSRLSRSSSISKFEGCYQRGFREGRGEVYDQETKSYCEGIWNDGRLKKKIKEFQCLVIPYFEIKKALSQHTQSSSQGEESNILGAGAWGTVYRAKKSLIPSLSKQDNVKGENVAVKVFENIRSGLQKKLINDKIKRAFELFSRIENKDNIMDCYGIFFDRKVGYVMELCSISVDHLIEGSNQALPFKEKYRILLETARGMQVLHDNQIMHRDLKWGNVLLDRKNRVKITDFDTIRQDENWRYDIQEYSSSNVGTAAFLAPEILSGKYSLSVDVYSYGLMIFSILFETNNPFTSIYTEEMERKKERREENNLCDSEAGEGQPKIENPLTCKCGLPLKSIPFAAIPQHVRDCSLRPIIRDEDVKKFIPEEFIFLKDLMKLCFHANPARRPTFSQLVDIFENQLSQRLKRSYTLLEIRFSPQQSQFLARKRVKLLLVKPSYENLISLIESTFPSKVKSVIFKEKLLSNDEDVHEMICTAEMPRLTLEFESVITQEELDDHFKETKKSGSIFADDSVDYIQSPTRPHVARRNNLMNENNVTSSLREKVLHLEKSLSVREEQLKQKILQLEKMKTNKTPVTPSREFTFKIFDDALEEMSVSSPEKEEEEEIGESEEESEGEEPNNKEKSVSLMSALELYEAEVVLPSIYVKGYDEEELGLHLPKKILLSKDDDEEDEDSKEMKFSISVSTEETDDLELKKKMEEKDLLIEKLENENRELRRIVKFCSRRGCSECEAGLNEIGGLTMNKYNL